VYSIERYDVRRNYHESKWKERENERESRENLQLSHIYTENIIKISI
jgi:hypothetical protein